MKKLETKQELYDLMNAAAASAATGASIESGLLWLLDRQALDAPGVARALHIPEQRCRYWLQFLNSLGVLDQTAQGYAPSALARAAILEINSEASWRHLVVDQRERAAGVHNLALYIGSPGSMWKAQGLDQPKDYVEKMRRDPERAREFTTMLYEVHQYLGNELAGLIDLSGARRMLDVGGNSGVIAMAFLKNYPALTATVVDLENVCTAGREIAAKTPWAERIEYIPLDIDQDEFPGGYDLVMLCDVGVFNLDGMRRLWASLNPGGRLVMVDHLALSEDIVPAKRLEWTFLDSLEDPDLKYRTLARARERLEQAGFQVLPQERMLSDQRIMVVACK